MSKLWKSTRKFISIFLMLTLPLLAIYPDMAEAGGFSAGTAFTNLLSNADTSTTTPGYYQSEGRGAFVAGGFDVHFANNNFSLINITPPSFSAGCGGISMFFGGFSFISGAQFSALVQNILQAAIGYAIQLAIQTLCPACEAVLQVLQKAAQMANSLSNNTCQMAKDAVNFGAKMLGIPGLQGSGKKGEASSQCAKDKASSGNGSGFLSSINSGLCQFASTANSDITKWMSDLQGPAQSQQADKHADEFGNLTYAALREAGVSSWEEVDILMSLIGTVVIAPPADCSSSNCPSSHHPYQPLSASSSLNKELKPLILAYMCGMSDSAALNTVKDNEVFCEDLAGEQSIDEGQVWSMLQTTPVYYCQNYTGNPAVNWPSTDIPNMGGSMGACSQVGSAEIYDVAENIGLTNSAQGGQWSTTSQTGFLAHVTTVLTDAVNDVENNTALGTQVIQLIQRVPFPLYQVIDLAAVYPSVATQLIDASSQSIALMLTEKMLMNVMHNEMEMSQLTNAPVKTVSLSGALNALSAIHTEESKVTQRALALNDYELQMMSEVRQVQRLIQDQVMQQGIMGNQQYSQALMSGITLGSGPQNTTAPTTST